MKRPWVLLNRKQIKDGIMSSSKNIILPTDRGYSAEHVWAKADGGHFVAGISDFAQDQLNDVMFVDLPETGKRFEAGEVFGSVESVKSVNDLYMPVSGVIIAVNEALADRPELVNSSPYEDGWMIRIQPDIAEPLKKLLDSEAYRKLL